MDGKKPAKAAGIEPWEDAGARCATLDPCVDLYLYSYEINGADPEPPIVSVFPAEVKSLADRYPKRGNGGANGFMLKRPRQRCWNLTLRRPSKGSCYRHPLRDFGPCSWLHAGCNTHPDL